MAIRSSKPRPRTPSIKHAVQHLHIRHRFPSFSGRRDGGAYCWRGDLQPRLSSPVYRVEIRCRDRGAPNVRVLSPPLPDNAPHRYPDGTLCLYWPKEWCWTNDKIIAKTVLPWAALWLYYYELWLDTGEWLGSSSHDVQALKFEIDRAA